MHLDRFNGPQEPPKVLFVGRIVLDLFPDRFFIVFASILDGFWDSFRSQKVKNKLSRSDMFLMRFFDALRRVSASL